MTGIPFNGQTYVLPDEIIGVDKSKYRVLEMLGRGGNGSVFECENVATGETFALKVLLNLKPPRAERFEREIQVISCLSHEHIVTYITHGRMSVSHSLRRRSNPKNKSYSRQLNVSFIIMRKADSNLREFLTQSSSPLRFEDYYGQFIGLAKALKELHAVAMHRDIKPDNILISTDVWQISDFGLCALIEEAEEQLTRAEEAVGPRYWMSPEAVSKAMGLGDIISCCSDLFQLASVFWFVVTQRPPIGILTMEDWSGPPSLGQLLLDTLQHNPLRRPISTAEFLQRLEEVKFS
ncbi:MULTISPECIES: protein kinase [Cyanophyceae]|uniref:serine/threonine protein kinase n=1 Tax=Cyanophyceae TaxID=3028117 RepID=UPI00168646C1|nr:MULTISPECIES: protein kinase [Cyanophyceae]MBD1915012.1 protein kinase [Phormidium sp. FACHB-77]MBD2032799.1 protein kinase [Phormidium sp. FACHB-322]MBD2049944.1 protein kinase [Leptolyngbya sp. FACHB-60]